MFVKMGLWPVRKASHNVLKQTQVKHNLEPGYFPEWWFFLVYFPGLGHPAHFGIGQLSGPSAHLVGHVYLKFDALQHFSGVTVPSDVFPSLLSAEPLASTRSQFRAR